MLCRSVSLWGGVVVWSAPLEVLKCPQGSAEARVAVNRKTSKKTSLEFTEQQ